MTGNCQYSFYNLPKEAWQVLMREIKVVRFRSVKRVSVWWEKMQDGCGVHPKLHLVC
jgi:hypothetical protein